MTKPITPAEAAKKKISSIPDEVFEVFNEMIAEKLRGGYATIMQGEAALRVLNRINKNRADNDKVTRGQLFDNGWMDVEPHYEKAGWSVEYDKPGYCETYEASFTFKKKRTRG